MKVVVIMNPRAGHFDRTLIEGKIREALFRCELRFEAPDTLEGLRECIVASHLAKVDALIVCGGDGTLNAVVGPLIRFAGLGRLPSVCIIPAGTANDLATEEKISHRVDHVARAILEGGIKTVDIIEITANGKVAYMLTNGGVGVPANTADGANLVRAWVRKKAADPNLPLWARPLATAASRLVKKAGSHIYEVMLLKEVIQWDAASWEVEVDIPGKTRFTTRAPFILVNNQPAIGGKFLPAPFTSNSDGLVNVVLIQPTKLLAQAKVILDMRMQRMRSIGDCPSFETAELRLKSVDDARPMTFFGDGEILHRDVRELTIRCLHPGLPIVKMGGS